ncbi:MAG: helix-turn-helix transcriptional regulator [Candidatus Liptonbacteria bacterium]|nr:helix-turn-helix transcriptional regulator [Candidatus Liptonbacteria bacterium]
MKKSSEEYNFTPLDKIIVRKLKSKKFSQSYKEELGRLKLAHEIKTLRQERKMTQKEVATKADMPQSVIARIESGTHSFSIVTLHKIAGVFDKEVGLVEQSKNRR